MKRYTSIFIRYFLSFVVCLWKWRAWPAEPTKLRAPKCWPKWGRRPACRLGAGETPALLCLAWLLPCALVHPGEAGFKGIDAANLPVKGRQQFPMIGVQLLQDGKMSGVD